MAWKALKALACLIAWKALKFFISSVIAIARGLLATVLTGITSPAIWVALEISSSVASPFLGCLMLYLKVGHETTGRSWFMGRGATRAALATLFCLLLIFLAGWLNQVLTYLCQRKSGHPKWAFPQG